MVEPLKAVGEDFTRATGVHLTFASGTTGVMLKRIRAGDASDVIIISAPDLNTLRTEGLVTAQPSVSIASTILGVAVKHGAAKPDISTPEAFKQAVVRAKSVAYPDPKLGATSGVYLTGLFDKLGIGDAVRAKAVLKANGAQTAAVVGTGEAELGITFVTEMRPDPRVDIVGPLPDAIQSPLLFAGAVSAKAANPAGARAFIAFAASPAERAALSATGAAPANP